MAPASGDSKEPDSRKRGADGRGPQRGNKRGRGGHGSKHRNSKSGLDRRAKSTTKDDDAKPVYSVEFSKEEIEGEARRPKRKVAVMIGYSGSGYKGMQLNTKEKTIEGDLFGAFVAAGAISKANADEPKKSSLVRCARTDKGVHAAGNVISLKLIVEDADIVQKINSHLSPQIRVWGIERVNGSFSSYQACDSRIYEYFIPTHCFIPPHPQSFLGKRLEELAEEAGDLEGYRSRQEDTSSFWADAEEKYIKPALQEFDADISQQAVNSVFEPSVSSLVEEEKEKFGGHAVDKEPSDPNEQNDQSAPAQNPINTSGVDASSIEPKPITSEDSDHDQSMDIEIQEDSALDRQNADDHTNTLTTVPSQETEPQPPTTDSSKPKPPPQPPTSLETAIRALKSAILKSKLAYRISPSRIARVESTLSCYDGTHRFHNYTPGKSPFEASAKRHIKSFVVSGEPLIISGTEWLSLKVHGQSFMMHQIRKMVSMAALVVRCGTHEGRIQDSFRNERISIPRAPGLGLLLERPVFDSYNKNVRVKGGPEKNEIGFEAYWSEMEEFKQREIYERIWREEEKEMLFHGLFAAVDTLKSARLFYVSSLGMEATKRVVEGSVEERRAKHRGTEKEKGKEGMKGDEKDEIDDVLGQEREEEDDEGGEG